MKTAMQELIEKLSNSIKFEYRNELVNALEKEKEQIIQAHNKGQSDYNPSLESIKFESEQYYNQTYNQNK